MALQIRRGTNQERLGITLVEGEVVYITDSQLTTIEVTSVNATTNVLTTSVEHGLVLNQQIKFIDDTSNGLTISTVYWVKTVPSTTTFTLSTSSGGSTVDITGTATSLVFATGPSDATGSPLGHSVAPIWLGDGVTVGGVPGGVTALADLSDVEIGTYGNVGQYGEVLNDNNVIQYNETTGVWENRANLTLNGHLEQTGQYLVIDRDAAGGDSYITFKNGAAEIKYDATDDRFELNKDLVATGVQGGNVSIGMGNDNAVSIGSNNLEINTDSGYSVNVQRDLVVGGNLTVNGTTTTVNSTTLTVDDKNIELGSVTTPTDVTALGGGITLKGASDKTILWQNSRWELNQPVYISGDLTNTGTVYSNGNLYLNYDQTAATDATIYFGQGDSQTDNQLRFDYSDDRFVVTNDLTSSGYIAAVGSLYTYEGLYLNNNFTDADVTINFGKTGSTYETLIWNTDPARFEFSDALKVDGNISNNGDISSSGNLELNNNYDDLDVSISFGKTGSTNETIAWKKDALKQRFELSTDTYANGYVEAAEGLYAGDDLYLNYNHSDNNVVINFGKPSSGAETVTYNKTDTRFDFSRSIYANDTVIAETSLATNGQNIYFNYDDGGSGATSTITVRRGSNADVWLRWNESNTRWESTINGTTAIALPNQALDTTSSPTFAGSTNGNIRVGVTGDNEIDTSTNNLTIDSAGGTVTVDDNLVVSEELRPNSVIKFGTTSGTIQHSTGVVAATFDGTGVTLQNLAITSNAIRNSGYYEAISFESGNQPDVTISNDLIVTNTLKVTGNAIKSSSGATAITLSTNDVVCEDALSVKGILTLHDINSPSTGLSSQLAFKTEPATTSQFELVTSTRNVIKAVVFISDGTDEHCVEILAMRTGASTAMMTAYGEMFSNAALSTFSAGINGSGDLTVYATPSSTAVDYSVVRTTLS